MSGQEIVEVLKKIEPFNIKIRRRDLETLIYNHPSLKRCDVLKTAMPSALQMQKLINSRFSQAALKFFS